VLHRGRVLASGDPQHLLADAGVESFEALFLAMAQEPAVD
jgi:hypothetical protein